MALKILQMIADCTGCRKHKRAPRKQVCQGNVRCKQIGTFITAMSPTGQVVQERAANRIMPCVFTFTKQAEGRDRYATNTIREGYHLSSSASNGTPFTLRLWSGNTTLFFLVEIYIFIYLLLTQQPTKSKSSTHSQNGTCLIASEISQFEILNPFHCNGPERNTSYIARQSKFLSVTIAHAIPVHFHLPAGPGGRQHELSVSH